MSDVEFIISVFVIIACGTIAAVLLGGIELERKQEGK